MTGWEPTIEAEVSLRDALRSGDQEMYFRVLARTELLLPVTADALAGRAPMGWGTWTADDRTHLLAFTSVGSMQACLAEHAGSARRVPFAELAKVWPNHEWWLAVNPGLPIEAYLPPWFVVQLARGDVRMPGRNQTARGRLERVEAMERAKAARTPHSVTEPLIVQAESTPTLVPRPTRELAAREHEPAPYEQPSPAGRPMSYAAAPYPAETYVSARAELYVAEAEGLASESAATEPAKAEPAKAEPANTEPANTEPANTEPAGTEPAGTEPATYAPAPVPMRPPTIDEPDHPDFVPANSVEQQLLDAADAGNTDSFVSTLLLATVLLLVPKGSKDSGFHPGDADFEWHTRDLAGGPYVVCYTSSERLAENDEPDVEAVPVRFIRLIRSWPDPTWSFAVNPDTPVGAKLPGEQLVALASWAAELGLEDDDASQPSAPATGTRTGAPARAEPEVTVMQKPIAPSQVGYYLDRGYDRVSGFMHRAREVGHLRTPEQLRLGLGLHWDGSPFQAGAEEIYVLRWSAYRPSLYRIPYGGQHEAGMKAMEGWVIERSPFRGNGFAPGDSDAIIAEFKLDSARLPHGARLLRVGPDGTEQIIAVLDSDGPRWLRTDGGE
jgi:hypothetical protein